MKKVIYESLFIAILGIYLVNCKKQNTNVVKENVELEADFNIRSDGRMLIFNSTNDYEKVVNNPNENIKTSFLNTVLKMEHITYSEQKAIQKIGNDKQIDDEYLGQILNKDLIVQIGNYLYRVNKSSESVYVLPLENIADYQDLVTENTRNSNIRKFSTDDNVIELAENSNANQKMLFCNESGIGGKESISNVVTIGSSNYQFWCYNDFNKFGIYFSLSVWVRSSAPNGTYRFYIQVENLWYHVRCGNTVGAYSFPWFSESPTTKNIHKYQSYSGSKNLNGVHVKSRGRCEIEGIPQGGNTYTTIFTDWNRIQQNNPTFP